MTAGGARTTVAGMGCLLALFAGAFPRVALFMFWILRPGRVDAAFDTWLVPLLGIVFLPFATLMYAVLYTPGIGLTGWEWFWITVAGLFDIAHLAVGASQRRAVPGRV
jgi:hypothetical protein